MKEQISEIMSTELITIDRYAKFSDLKTLLQQHHVRHILVKEGKKLLGILSTTDVLKNSFSLKMVGENKALDQILDKSVPLNTIMQTQVVTVAPETGIKEAANLLLSSSFNALPVVNADDELVGIVTTKDFLRYLVKQKG